MFYPRVLTCGQVQLELSRIMAKCLANSVEKVALRSKSVIQPNLFYVFDKFSCFPKEIKVSNLVKTSATVKRLTESLYGLIIIIYKAHGLSQVDIEV